MAVPHAAIPLAAGLALVLLAPSAAADVEVGVCAPFVEMRYVQAAPGQYRFVGVYAQLDGAGVYTNPSAFDATCDGDGLALVVDARLGP